MCKRARLGTTSVAALVAALLSSMPLVARDAVRTVPAPAVQTVDAPAPAPVPPAAPEIARTRPSAERADLQIMVDRAKVIRLPEKTQTVVIGNPAIADMAIQKNGIVVVTGKSYGTTNLIALDAAGNMLAESIVSVAASTEAIVVLQRGLERQSYSCTPRCQPSVALGDSNNYFSENRGQADARNQFATSR